MNVVTRLARVRGSARSICGKAPAVVTALLLAALLVSAAQEPAAPGLDEARRLIEEGRYAEAETIARKALSAAAPGNADSLASAEALEVIVLSLIRQERSAEPETRALAERLVRFWEARAPSEDPSQVGPLALLASVLRNAGKPAEAQPICERVLAIRRKWLPPDDPLVADSLTSLAVNLLTLGRYTESKALYLQALEIKRKKIGPNHPDVADALNGLAIVQRHLGEYAESRRSYEATLAIRREANGADHPEVARVLNGLGLLLQQTGDYAAATSRHEEALAIWRNKLGPDAPQVAWSLHNLALVLRDMGDYKGARSLLDRALEIEKKRYGPRHTYVATTLRNIGDLLYLEGDIAGARPLYEEALAIYRDSLGPGSEQAASCLQDLGTLSEAAGDRQQAGDLYERALAIRQKVFGREDEDVAETLSALARLKLAAGDDAGARSLYENVHAIRLERLGPRHPLVAASLVGLGEVLAMEGESDAALDDVLQAEEISREHVRLTSRTLPERQALGYAAARASGLDLAIWLAGGSSRAVPDAQERAFDALIRSRALVLDEMVSRQRAVKGAADPEVARLLERVASNRTRLANLIVRGADRESPLSYRGLLDAVRHEVEGAEGELAEKSLAFRRELATRRIGLKEVEKTLPPSSALVAFALYQRPGWAEQARDAVSGNSRPDSRVPLPRKPQPVASYVAFVLRSGAREVRLIPIGPTGEIDRLVDRWKEQAGHPVVGTSPSAQPSESDYRAAASALRVRIWDPLVPALGGATRVFIVPEGSLNLVNFAALPAGRTAYLIEHGPLVHYLSAERDLVTLETAGPHGEGLLVLGGPDFDATSMFAALTAAGRVPAASAVHRSRPAECSNLRSVIFEQLPGSIREAEEVIELYEGGLKSGKQSPSGAGGDAGSRTETGGILLTGEQATEAAFKQEAPGKRILHLATHAFFLEGGCASSFDEARGIGGLVTASVDLPPPGSGENPLLLSGLVLAGANHRGAACSGEEDGILTAEEIGAMDLSSVEWVVLSACDTAAGRIQVGEGVFGLRRAFQDAGVWTLIMSLWSVEDASAREWMAALYKARFKRAFGTAQAVHAASLELLQRHRSEGRSTHPFYWAAFVAAGGWQ